MGKKESQRTAGTKILLGEEFKSKGAKPSVSAQVSLTLPEKTSGQLLRGQGTCRGQVSTPSPSAHQVPHRHSQAT